MLIKNVLYYIFTYCYYRITPTRLFLTTHIMIPPTSSNITSDSQFIMQAAGTVLIYNTKLQKIDKTFTLEGDTDWMRSRTRIV